MSSNFEEIIGLSFAHYETEFIIGESLIYIYLLIKMMTIDIKNSVFCSVQIFRSLKREAKMRFCEREVLIL